MKPYEWPVKVLGALDQTGGHPVHSEYGSYSKGWIEWWAAVPGRGQAVWLGPRTRTFDDPRRLEEFRERLDGLRRAMSLNAVHVAISKQLFDKARKLLGDNIDIWEI
jgi:hypothetical protein